MSAEAPKKIEELLQRYARKRREQGGDFSLHRATRRLLQGEVGRQHGRSEKPQSNLLAWFGLWRGRFAFGVAAAAVLVLTTWMFWNNQQLGQPMQLARNESVRDAEKSMEARGVVKTEPATEAAKTVALAEAPRPLDESRDGLSRKEPTPGLAAPTMSLTPAANASAGAKASDFFFSANGAIPSTNLFAYTVPKAAGPNNQAMSPATPGVQLSYFDNTKADRSGPAPAAQPAGRLTGVEAPSSARLSVAATNTGAVGGNAFYANDFQAKEVTANLAIADPKRLAESSDPQSRSGVGKAQTESLAFGVNRSAAEEGLARNRKMNINQPGAAGGTQAKGAVDSLAAVDNPAATPAEAKAKTEVALNLPAQAAGDLQRDASTATRFYRQTELGQLSDVVQMERETDALKKAEKSETAPVLGRFTVEQQGKWLRIREPDGSVYEGPITGPVVAANAESSGARDKDALVREKAVTLKSSPANRDGEYSFQASGSNVTLRQMIVVNGRFRAADDSIAPPAGAAAPLRPAPVRRALTPPASGRGGGAGVATNRISKIEGTVRVGAANEQPFKAVRATR